MGLLLFGLSLLMVFYAYKIATNDVNEENLQSLDAKWEVCYSPSKDQLLLVNSKSKAIFYQEDNFMHSVDMSENFNDIIYIGEYNGSKKTTKSS